MNGRTYLIASNHDEFKDGYQHRVKGKPVPQKYLVTFFAPCLWHCSCRIKRQRGKLGCRHIEAAKLLAARDIVLGKL